MTDTTLIADVSEVGVAEVGKYNVKKYRRDLCQKGKE